MKKPYLKLTQWILTIIKLLLFFFIIFWIASLHYISFEITYCAENKAIVSNAKQSITLKTISHSQLKIVSLQLNLKI